MRDFTLTVRRLHPAGNTDQLQFDVAHKCKSSQCPCATLSMDKIIGLLSDIEFQTNAANEPLATTRGVVRIVIDLQ